MRAATATAFVVFPLSSTGLNANASRRLTSQMQGEGRERGGGKGGRRRSSHTPRLPDVSMQMPSPLSPKRSHLATHREATIVISITTSAERLRSRSALVFTRYQQLCITATCLALVRMEQCQTNSRV